ncbi:MAG: hypothetical protein ABSE71_04245 [Candidatus Micrarchaeaceae archaeon]|jgi:hypothetical protein|nr:hypothetical protein [Candidatus Micrarchaeota archaeon]HII10072.1 hypothetical protein [Candidatus Micrarchaeota archaeon]
MMYQIRINRRISNIKVYSIKKRVGKSEGFMTKLFIRLFNQGKKSEGGPAAERLR